jgi:hypothetical protein
VTPRGLDVGQFVEDLCLALVVLLEAAPVGVGRQRQRWGARWGAPRRAVRRGGVESGKVSGRPRRRVGLLAERGRPLGQFRGRELLPAGVGADRP